MAELSTTSEDLRFTYVEKPNMRFATTFISNKYRDYAVKGEVLMDKATGEIFTKRPEDGRVVSFFQNKKYMHDLMLELRVLLNNNARFTYPSITDVDSFFLSTDYDIMSIYGEKDTNIATTDMTIPNIADIPVSNLRFNISKKCNGFFCRLTSRDSDKAVIEWITNQYNAVLKNYYGTVESFINEKNKFNAIEKWEDSNATIEYRLTIVKNGEERTFPLVDYVRINEESCVLFPDSITEAYLADADSVYVTINKITYDKIKFMIKYRASFSVSFIDGVNKFICPDNLISVRYCNICSFVDKSTDINLLGNEFIIAMLDTAYVRRYMMKMGKLNNDANIILSKDRPSDDTWVTNGIWAEKVRNVYQGGKEVNYDCEVDISTLEMYLADSNSTDFVHLSDKETDTRDIYGKDVTGRVGDEYVQDYVGK